MKILLFDIEIIHHAFGDSWQTMASNNGSVCSFGWKWEGEKKAHCIGLDKWEDDFLKNPYNDKNLVKEAYDIMKQADGLVAHYGNNFDIKYMRTKFMQHGLDPQVLELPSRDTCLLARKKFKFSSNRLKALAENFGLQNKDPMEPMDWFQVIRSDLKTMKKMNKYCKQDVEVLDQVYQEVKHLFSDAGWPNKALADKISYNEACPSCGNKYTYQNGYNIKKSGVYKRLMCKSCGKKWQKSKGLTAEEKEEYFSQ